MQARLRYLHENVANDPPYLNVPNINGNITGPLTRNAIYRFKEIHGRLVEPLNSEENNIMDNETLNILNELTPIVAPA